jgi:hypothetical protein
MKRIGYWVDNKVWLCSSITEPGTVYIQGMYNFYGDDKDDFNLHCRMPAKACREFAHWLVKLAEVAEQNAEEAGRG